MSSRTETKAGSRSRRRSSLSVLLPSPSGASDSLRPVRIEGWNPDGTVDVRTPGSPDILRARSLVPPAAAPAGCEGMARMERDGQPPILMGVFQDSLPAVAERPGPGRRLLVELEGKRVKLDAGEELVLSCGKSSLSLAKDGTVVLKGVNILSRAAATNKVKGAAVHLN